MFGFKKRYNTVVMDSSNPNTLRGITLLAEMISGASATRMHGLDVNHPTMTVLETRCSENVYRTLQFAIEECYPGLCAFGVRV